MELITKQRIALSTYFFLSGLCFATWASRIPTIKDFFNFNEAELGSVLLAMPISSLIGLPFSGWLVSKFDSRFPLIVSIFFFTIALTCIGFATTPFLLVASLCLFSFNSRILNIAMNTQSITLQKKYSKKIVGSFHGLWSTGGLLGVGFSTIMVKENITLHIHLLIIALFTIIISLIAFRFTLKNDKSTFGNKLIFGKPDPFILYLGMLVFFAAVCEGGMFDWSGVYFKDVIKEDVFTYGYLLFIASMAISRFYSDKLMDLIGMQKTYILSAVVIAAGILIAITFPYFYPALFGFCLVGFGTAAIFPMTFMLAGTSKKYSPGMAISIITTYATLGMLIGPPLVGYVAHAFGLKNAFYIFVISGLLFIPVSQLFFRYQKQQQ
ncbi:MFS transporter [Lutibacter sp. HS1-25]|uniref:MFS transporter n=1 Tax=Lutibacter sp. HS1-25 TaxID=2485000 RepID=UPI0010129AEE|nr:MFS transporter [Lutibacter sp. HS1-25]RXP57099.1 MFS transporter [Lutibacter sp. HS1-25]